jgi:hypothetical protein
MAKQTIGIGTTANDGTGDSIRVSFDKVNDNFEEIYDGTAALTAVTTNEIISPTNDLEVTLSANKTLVLSEPVYRDELPSYITVAGASAAPGLVDHTIGGVLRRLYGFDGGTSEERISGSFEIPHDYMYGEDIEVHIHVRPATTGTGVFKFFFDWEHSPANAAPAAQTSLTLTYEIVANEQYFQLVKTFGNLPDLGFELGDKIGFNLRRDPADGADTYTGDVLFEQIALHVPCDTQGSRQLYVK